MKRKRTALLVLRENIAEAVYDTFGEKPFDAATVIGWYPERQAQRVRNAIDASVRAGIFKRLGLGRYQFIPL